MKVDSVKKMTDKEREDATLSFLRPRDRGSVQETFYPWTLTVDSFITQGLPLAVGDYLSTHPKQDQTRNITADNNHERYFPIEFGEKNMIYEKYLGFDAVFRIGFVLPFRYLPEKITYEDDRKLIKTNRYGHTECLDKITGKTVIQKEAVCDVCDWNRIKKETHKILSLSFTEEIMRRSYARLKIQNRTDTFSIRLNLEGFFWIPRELLGIERHLFAFHDAPELIHDINKTVLDIYQEQLSFILKVLPVDVVYIMEDLSGKNGPMISPAMFDEFVGKYYRQLVPMLKHNGVKHVFVDTDGDFMKLIPNFIDAGIEGFLPLDVNAGMDIIEVRKMYPTLKLIGGYNKLCILQGKDTIDKEFERILPVIRQGGYIVGVDHQVVPITRFEDYQYYICQLKQVMKQTGTDIDA